MSEKIKTIGSVESITGGMFANEITNIPGASKFFKGSIIAYSNEIKENILKIDTSKGTVNSAVALEMAAKGKELLNVDICVAFTGNAGPSALDNLPVGKVFIAINDLVFEKDFSGSRLSIKEQSVHFALNYLIDNGLLTFSS